MASKEEGWDELFWEVIHTLRATHEGPMSSLIALETTLSARKMLSYTKKELSEALRILHVLKPPTTTTSSSSSSSSLKRTRGYDDDDDDTEDDEASKKRKVGMFHAYVTRHVREVMKSTEPLPAEYREALKDAPAQDQPRPSQACTPLPHLEECISHVPPTRLDLRDGMEALRKIWQGLVTELGKVVSFDEDEMYKVQTACELRNYLLMMCTLVMNSSDDILPEDLNWVVKFYTDRVPVDVDALFAGETLLLVDGSIDDYFDEMDSVPPPPKSAFVAGLEKVVADLQQVIAT
jgi:hypothetical protein